MTKETNRHLFSNSFGFVNLVLRGLRYHLRSHIMIVFGCAVGAILLTGALMIGDSLQRSLHFLARSRLGKTQHVIFSSNATFRESFADSIGNTLDINAVPLLLQKGTVSVGGKNNRLTGVNIIGADQRFETLSPGGNTPAGKDDSTVVVNKSLADRLQISAGEKIIIRFSKAGVLSLDAPFANEKELGTTLRMKVGAVADRQQFGDFNLKAEHYTVYNVFVPLHILQTANSTPQGVSAILIGQSDKHSYDELSDALQRTWSTKYGGVSTRSIKEPQHLEIYSDNIFLSDSLVTTICKTLPEATPVSTWFVNEIRFAEKKVPYSFVSTPPVDIGLERNQIALGSWAARDLGAGVGDSVVLSYFVPTQSSGLRTDSSTFVISTILPEQFPWIDSTLMPPLPGLAQAVSCTEWDPGIPINLESIRQKDEAYWEKYKGAPKAFINYHTAQTIWNNRFGFTTSIRIDSSKTTAKDLSTILDTAASPSSFGIRLFDIKSNIDNAVDEGISFTPLFIGLSFFTILGALILISILCGFLIRSRKNDIRVLSAIGYTRSHILKLFMFEGFFIASLGTITGMILSPLYTILMLKGLGTIWQAAAKTPVLFLHVHYPSILTGGLLTILCASAAMFLPLQTALNEFFQSKRKKKKKVSSPLKRLIFSSALILVGIILTLGIKNPNSTRAAGIFFMSGSILLAGMISLFSSTLRLYARKAKPLSFSLKRLALLNLARKPGRSTATICILACALFILSTIQIFKLGTYIDPRDNRGGTGGFWWYGEFASGISDDEISADLLRNRGVEMLDNEFTSLPIRMKDGDDASCLNLNRVNQPALVGVNSFLLDSLNCFSFSSSLMNDQQENKWSILETSPNQNTIYGFADQSSIEWIMGKTVGDTLRYTNEIGDTLHVILAGGLQNSILHGKVIISEQNFIRHFPSTGGYRIFLVTAPSGKEKEFGDALNDALVNKGGLFETTKSRLQTVNSVTNTYLSIFGLLGMMGLMLGCLGLGIVFVRNIHERRIEIGILHAQGFRYSVIYRLLFWEHAVLIFAGTAAGMIPALFTSGFSLRVASLPQIAVLLFVVLTAGFGSMMIGLALSRKTDCVTILQDDQN